MRASTLALVALLGLAISPAEAAGMQFLEVPADAAGPALKGAVWYPCAATASDVGLGSSTIRDAKDCPVAGEHLPLIVISHGTGGFLDSHRDTAETLAEAGFVVATISHPGDNVQDLSRQGTRSVLIERPADMKRLVDYMLAAWSGRAKLDAERIGFFGFSAGGYTGLVVAGGNPDLGKIDGHCQDVPSDPMCDIGRARRAASGEDLSAPASFTHDPRVKAAVIAAPAIGFAFAPDRLKEVAIPIELWRAANDEVLLHPYHAQAVYDALPTKPDYHVIENAGHYAFLAPCSPRAAKAVPEICTDRPGFDRVAFHRELNGEIVAFFRRNLVAGGKP
jgi:predicted dienelactone hydrolase